MDRPTRTWWPAMALLLALAIASPATSSAAVRFLDGANASTVTAALEPWTQSEACACCVCWETALSTVYAWWDDRKNGGEGPWTRLLPGGDGFYEPAFRATSQKIFDLADIDCNQGGFSGFWFIASKATSVGKDYTRGLGYDFDHDFDDWVSFSGDIADEIDANKPVYYAFTGPFKGDDNASHATVAVGYDTSDKILYIYNNWDPWTDARGFADDSDSRTINITPGGCDCTSGTCCNGCAFKPAGTVCDPSPRTEWGCPWGTDCGSDVGWRTYNLVCNGESSACLTSSYGPWSAWSVAFTCNENQRCVQGNNACMTYSTCTPAQDACLEAERRCATQNSYQVCAAPVLGGALAWGAPMVCSKGLVCEGGLCVPPCENTCVEGERRCAGAASVQTCGLTDDGCYAFEVPKDCGPGKVCSGGECVEPCEDECGPDERRCAEDAAYQLCGPGTNDDCLHFGDIVACPTGWTCDAGWCVMPEVPDDVLPGADEAVAEDVVEAIVPPDPGAAGPDVVPDLPVITDGVGPDGTVADDGIFGPPRSSGGCAAGRTSGGLAVWVLLVVLGLMWRVRRPTSRAADCP